MRRARGRKRAMDWLDDKRAPVLVWMEDGSCSPSLHYLLHAGGNFPLVAEVTAFW